MPDSWVEPEGWPMLLTTLEEARRRGFLGPDQMPERVARHAAGFAGAVGEAAAILDLGSGGGVPGLVVAALRPAAQITLVDARESRTDWLQLVVSRLGWADRVQVITVRAEVMGHDPQWRGSQDAVVARSFGPPLVTAECAAALLREGGRLVVSEPPDDQTSIRWPPDQLAELGLARQPWPDRAYAVMEQRRPCPAAVPRAGVVRGRTS